MKQYTNKNIVVLLIALVVLASLYRIMPNRPYGFAPQIAIALFSGALFVKNKKWAFALPLLSMFLSDCLYQLLYVSGLSEIRGFYEGQWENYLLFAGVAFIGFAVKMNKVPSILVGALAAPTAYFLASNFLVWVTGGGYVRSKTFSGLLQSYSDGLPFYKNSVIASLVFSTILFGGYYLVKKYSVKKQLA
ncbi:DUF6580 family putative transport protein [Chitinophagaceae bacterium LWZ2-11]